MSPVLSQISLFSEIGSLYITQAGVELMFSCLHLLTAGITGVPLYSWLE
jgi:hypothetical protein